MLPGSDTGSSSTTSSGRPPPPRQALEIFLEFGDRHGAASTYHQLGMVAQEQRRFEQAEAHYRQALEIFLEFGDRHGAAITYHQLGSTLNQLGRRTEALRAWLGADAFESEAAALIPADLKAEFDSQINRQGET